MAKKGKKIDHEIHIGYINKFKFFDITTEDLFQGHPKEGRVYQVIKDDMYGYRLHVGAENTKERKLEGLLLGTSLKGDYEDKWVFDVELVTKENFASFSFSDEDIQKVEEWFSTDNEKLNSILGRPTAVTAKDENGNLVDVTPLITGDSEQAPDTDFSAKVNDYYVASQKILFQDPEAFEVLSDVMVYLASTFGDKYEAAHRPNLAKDFLLTSDSPETAVFNSMKYLQRYCTKGFEKSYNKKDVMKAIHYCIFELQRRNNEQA